MKLPAGKKPTQAGKQGLRRTEQRQSETLPLAQLKLVMLAGLVAGAGAALILVWDRIYPTPPEDLIEVVWTHECRCVDEWMNSLRAKGFVVRDFELDSLTPTRQRWGVPDAARGCHPARYMGYAIDGHIPPETLRKLGREHPAAVGLIQVSMQGRKEAGGAMASQDRFELVEPDGEHHLWP